jgi:hypothetical protein
MEHFKVYHGVSRRHFSRKPVALGSLRRTYIIYWAMAGRYEATDGISDGGKEVVKGFRQMSDEDTLC